MGKSDKIEKACKEFGISKEQLEHMMSPNYLLQAYKRNQMIKNFIAEQEEDDDEL